MTTRTLRGSNQRDETSIIDGKISSSSHADWNFGGSTRQLARSFQLSISSKSTSNLFQGRQNIDGPSVSFDNELVLNGFLRLTKSNNNNSICNSNSNSNSNNNSNDNNKADVLIENFRQEVEMRRDNITNNIRKQAKKVPPRLDHIKNEVKKKLAKPRKGRGNKKNHGNDEEEITYQDNYDDEEDDDEEAEEDLSERGITNYMTEIEDDGERILIEKLKSMDKIFLEKKKKTDGDDGDEEYNNDILFQ